MNVTKEEIKYRQLYVVSNEAFKKVKEHTGKNRKAQKIHQRLGKLL